MPSLHLESHDSTQQLVDDAVARLRSAEVEAKGQVGAGSGSAARELLVNAERKPLEEVATPLTAVRKEMAGPAPVGRDARPIDAPRVLTRGGKWPPPYDLRR